MTDLICFLSCKGVMIVSGVSIDELLQMKLLAKAPMCSVNSKMVAANTIFNY